jgi:ketosteroid isomerase-like protein
MKGKVMRIFCLVLLAMAMAIAGSNTQPETSPSDCENVRVQRELEDRYAQLEDANRRKDLDGLLALRTRDCAAEEPKGHIIDCPAMADYSRAMFQQVEKIATQRNTILGLKLNGDEATATVFQQFSRTQKKAGRVRNVETSAIQDETWVRESAGWKIRRVSNVHARKWYVDGKRVDPKKPYDPDALPYNPPIDADE